MMIAQVMQQLFGPVLQRASSDLVSPLGGDQGDEFAGLMDEGDDSPVAAEGVMQAVIDSPLPPMATPDPAVPTPPMIAAQFSLPTAAQGVAGFQTSDMTRPSAAQDRVGESQVAANLSAAPVLPNTPPVLAADIEINLVESAALTKIDARAPVGQGAVVIDPLLTRASAAEGWPDLSEMVPKLTSYVAQDLPRTAPKGLNAAQTPVSGAGKAAANHTAAIATNAKATNANAVLDGPIGATSQPSASITPSAAPNIAPQSLSPKAKTSFVAGFGARADGSIPTLAQQPNARTADDPAPVVTPVVALRPVAPPASVAFAALHTMVQSADIQTQDKGARAAISARVGEPVSLQTATAQQAAAVLGQGAVPTAAQTSAQITAALFASAAGDAADLLGTAPDEDAAISVFGIEARHAFGPSHSLGAGAAGASSPTFAGSPPTAAQLSAQLLPLAQSAQSGPVELVLSPAELGQLRFEIQHRGDQVQIVLSAERPETLDLLRRNGEQLLTDFRNAGFAGASLAFGGWAAGQNAGAKAQEFDQGSQDDGGGGAVQTPASPPSQNATFARAQSYLDPSRSLNLRL